MRTYFAKLPFLLMIVLVATVTSAQERVTIRWWHINNAENESSVWQQVANDFVTANPHVNIEITILENDSFKTRLVTVMQAGDPPDVFQSWGGAVLWTYARAGLLRNIAPELEGEWMESFATPAALELYGQNGEYYGVPWSWGAVGIFYNKALFAQAGLDPENPPTTWDEFLGVVQTLKDAGITPISLGESEKWPGHFWWVYLALRHGGADAFLNAYNRTGTFADAPYIQAGESLNELIALDPFPAGFLGMTYPQQAAMIGNGQAAMELMGQWAPGVQAGYSESGEGLGDDLGWFPFPMVEGGAGHPQDVLGGGDGFAVGRNAPDEAVEFLRYLTSVEVQRRAAEVWVVPTVKGAEDVLADNPLILQIMEARNNATYSQLYYDQFLPPALGQTVNDAVEALFAGMASAEEAALMIEDVASFEL